MIYDFNSFCAIRYYSHTIIYAPILYSTSLKYVRIISDSQIYFLILKRGIVIINKVIIYLKIIIFLRVLINMYNIAHVSNSVVIYLIRQLI